MNTKGFAHLGLIVGVIVLVVIGGVGYSVYKASNKISPTTQDTTDSFTQETHFTTIESKNDVKPTEADVEKPIDAGHGESKQQVVYDITTPYGTLKHIEQEAKAGRLGNLAWFTTPRMLFRSAYMLNTAEETGEIERTCERNTVCLLGINSTTLTENYTTEEYDFPYASVEGKTLIYKLKEINAKAAKIYGNVDVRIDMLDIDSNWVVDRVTVGSYVL